MTEPQRESRHYRVLGLIGQGGHGRVYHARLEGHGGFKKDVAIKLLKELEVPEPVLQRFRDEARILGLVRDRAIVSVDPPVRLAGRWAIIMEYVGGVSAQRLLKARSVPARVALEIVQEVARVLDKVYRSEGPDGLPLHLVHRDVKPANIQVTRDGEVKLLDFGLARAEFVDREAETSNDIGGTYGFIAPERLKGIEGPAGDVYSLGVTLRVLLTGERATVLGPATLEALPREALRALQLAEELRVDDPAQRPTARAVEDAARRLCATTEGPSLREWAEMAVPPLQRAREDSLVGSILTESVERDAIVGLPPRSRSRTAVAGVAAGALAGGTAVVAALVGVLLVVGGLMLVRPPTGPTEATSAGPDPLGRSQLSPPVPGPAPTEILAPTAVPAPIEAPTPAPVEAPPLATPRPPAPAPPTAPAPAALVTVEIESTAAAEVWVDGVRIGVTPLRGHPMTAGSHQLRLVAGGAAVEARVWVGGKRGATRFSWDGGPALTTR